jgi:hypothetical protein
MVRKMSALKRLLLITATMSCACLSACRAGKGPESAASVVPRREPVAATKIRRTLLETRSPAGLPGWETRLYLVEYGPRAVATLHVHPAVGIGFVIEGSFESAFGTDPPVTGHAGEGFVDSAGTPHRLFRNLSADSELRFVIAYTIRAGEEMFYPGAGLAVPAH